MLHYKDLPPAHSMLSFDKGITLQRDYRGKMLSRPPVHHTKLTDENIVAVLCIFLVWVTTTILHHPVDIRNYMIDIFLK
ncbi:hypothetical protein PENSTE_c010G00984 [Penicillium steckii]|uniref:Uncharacterized protein n=1 Tax=Penicillium steckii TaxID=303698 RepID=A0A1V6T8S5_9EURO|nr:hypothetical protein PENSTE_c010G00984 [Penicillium steckii]